MQLEMAAIVIVDSYNIKCIIDFDDSYEKVAAENAIVNCHS